MCTVSFYKNENHTIITSNRDEHIDRPLAIAPKKYTFNGKTVYYPKDPKAGGTWFVVTINAEVFVLLNGAEKKHSLQSKYRKSRGIILLELSTSDHLIKEWENIDLNRIEPFTIVAYTDQNFVQLRWDGLSKSLVNLDRDQPRIWSSATLYSTEVIKHRENWFSDFMNKKLEPKDLIHFHTNTQSDDSKNGLMIDRNQTMLTKNLTQCVVNTNRFKIIHFDYISDTKKQITENIL